MTASRNDRTEAQGGEEIYDDSSDVLSCRSVETELTTHMFQRVAMGTMGSVSVFP
jgi:hypothetical protein